MTGSSVFDFEGDGAAEVVYADEETLWILDGATGQVELAWDEHDSGTRFEYPTIVDIDKDGSAEILLPEVETRCTGSVSLEVMIARGHQRATSGINTLIPSPILMMMEVSPPTRIQIGYSGIIFEQEIQRPEVGLSLPDIQIGDPSACLYSCGQGLMDIYIPVEKIQDCEISEEDYRVRTRP